MPISQQATVKLLRILNASSFQKLLIISASTHCLPHLIKILAFVWSQFQLLTLLGRAMTLCLFGEVPQLIILVEKYLFFANLFEYSDSSKITFGMLGLALLYLIIPTLLAIWIMYALRKMLAIPDFVVTAWKVFLDLHVLILFFPIHLNSVGLISDWLQKNQSAAGSIKICALVVLIFNLILTLSSAILCHINLKTKNALSSKTNTLSILELLTKSLLPFFIYHNNESKGGKTILMILVCLYCLDRDSLLLRILPYYRLRTLKTASITHAIITSMVLAGIMAKLFLLVHDWKQYRVVGLLWIVFGFMLIKIYTLYLNKKLLKIMQDPNGIKKASDLAHYWEIYKYYSKYGLTEISGEMIPRDYFDFMSITTGNRNFNDLEGKIRAHQMKKEMFYERNIELLKEFIQRYPENSWLAELTLAKIYTKQESSCILASHIGRGSKNKSFLDQTSLLIIKLNLLKKLSNNCSQETLDVRNFIETQAQYKSLQKNIVKNIEHHIQFWKTFSSAKPSFIKMIELAKKNLAHSRDFKYLSGQCKDFKKAAFSEPLLICSLYCYFFQDETLLAESLLREYFQTSQKQGSEKNDSLKFTNKAIYFIVSSEEKKLGEILDCSGKVNSVLGYSKELLIGKSLRTLLPVSFDYAKEISNKTIAVSVQVQEGYLRLGILHHYLNYVQGHGLCYNVLLECVENDTRLAQLGSDGTLLNYSKNFEKDLGFEECQDQFNITDFCPGFWVKTFASNANYEIELSFFPFWSQEETKPIIFRAKIKRFEIRNGDEIFEIIMQKLSSFSFIPPKIFKRKSLKVRRSSKLPSLSRGYPKKNPKQILNERLQSQEAFSSANSTTQRLLSPGSTKTERHFEFTRVPMGTTAEAALNSQPDPVNGDEDFSDQEDKGQHLTTLTTGAAGDGNVGYFQKDQQEEGEEVVEIQNKGDLLEDIFGNYSIESGNGRLESSKFIQRQKVVKRLLQDRTHRTETKLFIASFAITCLVLLTLLIWLNFYTSTTSKDVMIYSDALQNAYFRSYWTKIANQDTLYWLGAMIEWVDYDIDILITGFNKSFHKMIYYNQALENSVSLISEELQDMHYKKNVRIYDRDLNYEKELVGYDDTFQATKRIFDRGMTNFHRATTGYNFEEKVNQDSYFIFDNSLNDLQIQEEGIIVTLLEYLLERIQTSRRTMVEFMGATFGVVFLFVIFSLKYLVTVNIEFKRFMKILYTLRKPDIKNIELVSSTFKELLERDSKDKDSFLDLYYIEKNQAKTEVDKENAKRGYYFEESLQGPLKQAYVKNLLLLLGLLVFTGATVGFAFIYYQRSSNKLDVMQKQQSNISSALQFVNSLSWVTAEIQLISLFNFTLPTKNVPIESSILGDIEKLKQVNTLQKSLLNSQNDFSPEIKSILFNFSCENAYSPYYSYELSLLKSECEDLSNGDNYVGLLEITSRLGMLLSTDVPALYEGPKDLEALKAFYQKVLDIYGPLIDIEFVLLLSAYSVGIQEFEYLVEELKVSQVTLAWVAVTFSFLLGVVTWIFIMRKIVALDFESKEILLFVPARVLVKNPQLKMYLRKTAKSDDTIAQSLLR